MTWLWTHCRLFINVWEYVHYNNIFSFTYQCFILLMFRWRNCWKKCLLVTTGRSWWTLLCRRLQISCILCLKLKLWRSEICEAFTLSSAASVLIFLLISMVAVSIIFLLAFSFSLVGWPFMVARCWSPIPPCPADSKRQISHGASCIDQRGGQLSPGDLYQTQSHCGLGCHYSCCKL